MQQYFAEEDSKSIPDAFALLPDIPNYSPIQRIHHVVLYLPQSAPSVQDVSAMNVFVDNWLNRQNLSKLRKALAIGDSLHPTGYTWPDRGWSSDDVFDPQIKASLKKYGSCIISRKLSFEEAVRLQRRLSNAKCAFTTSAIALPLETSITAPTCQRDHGHTIRETNFLTLSSGISCPLCDCECLSETVYTCEDCYSFQSCQFCHFLQQSLTSASCRVFIGHLVGTRIVYPPQDAAIDARKAVVAIRGEDPDVQDEMRLRDFLRSQARNNEERAGTSNSNDNDSDGISGHENSRYDDEQGRSAARSSSSSAILGNISSNGSSNTDGVPSILPSSSTQPDAATASTRTIPTSSLPTSTTPATASTFSSSGGGSSRPDRETLISRFMRNKKPKTKKSVLEGLPNATYCVESYENQTDCIMCQCPFVKDDSIVILPCKHIFHGDGPKNDESADCPLLTDWLKKNNDCPICRHALPAEERSDKWTCPFCSKSQSLLKCLDCNLGSNVVMLVENHEEGFQIVENLYLEITEFRLNTQLGVFDDAQYSILLSHIDGLINSSFINGLAGANWDIAEGLRKLLEQNLSGFFELEKCIAGLDGGSASLLRVIVRQITTKNKQKFPDDVIPKPIPPPPRVEGWACPLCSCSSNNLASRNCSNCEASQGPSNQRNSPNITDLYARFSSLCIRGLHLALGVNKKKLSESEIKSTRSQLKQEITMFLDSRKFMDHFENAGYLIKRHLIVFFNRVLKYKVNFPFTAEGYSDINSVSAYANFIHDLRSELQKSSTLRAAFTVEKPNAESVQSGETFESFADHRYPPSPNSGVIQFLEGNRDSILNLCRNLSFGTTTVMWQQLTRAIEQIDALHPGVKSAIVSINGGMRDLPTLVQGLAPDSKFIIEAIHRKVVRMEVERSFIDADDVISYGNPVTSLEDLVVKAGGGGLFSRQYSIGTDTLSALRTILDEKPEDFPQVLTFIYKIVKNINAEPNKLEFRRLSKDIINKYLSKHPAAISVLHFIGFQGSAKDPNRLYLRELDRDMVARCHHVICELAADSGLTLN